MRCVSVCVSVRVVANVLVSCYDKDMPFQALEYISREKSSLVCINMTECGDGDGDGVSRGDVCVTAY